MNADPVTFPEGETGSSLLRAALADAAAAHPSIFEGISIPDSVRAFKRAWPEVLGEFEARRAASAERVAVARRLAAYLAERTLSGAEPLPERLARPDVIELSEPGVREGSARPGWVPTVQWRGEDFEGSRIGELAERMREACQITEDGARALRWVADNLLREPLVLTDQRFALLGAGAELAPTRYLLAAGARVLWVDRQPPMLASDFAGTLVQVPGAADLLAEATTVGAALAREAARGPLHVGLYAYAPGRGRELRLTAAMNAIASAVEPASVTLLVSPTTPGEVAAACRTDRATRAERALAWQRALRAIGALGEAPCHRHDDVEIARSIVGLQGPTYQAAQYLAKMMVAEAWVVDRQPMRVSANVAGITHTRSLEHPLFLAGFLGAPAFGIQIFEPEQTRVLMTLLMLHDVLAPGAPSTRTDPLDRARAVVRQSVHGGVRSAPFALDPTIRVAAMLGLARRPGLLARLAGGR